MISTLKFPQLSYTGWGAMENLAPELIKRNVTSILIVTDPVLIQLGMIDKMIASLDVKFRIKLYSDVEPEPSLECAQKLIDFARNGSFDCVIGIGGGSTLDLAKLTAVVYTNDGDVKDYLNLTGTRVLKHKGIPKILIPTTSGTGSEVTDISVLSLEHTKDVITHEYLIADVAIVDPELTLTLPSRVTAATGVDALTHAIESFLSVNANVATDALAIKAIELLANSLRSAVHQGDDKKARTDMSYGSYLAGLSFFNAGVGGVHALAYPLGSQFGIPHGEANAVLLPYVIPYISSKVPQKMIEIRKLINKEEDHEDTPLYYYKLLKKLISDVQLPTSIKEYGVQLDDLSKLTEDATKQTRLLARSPMPLLKNDIYQIYQMAYEGKFSIDEI
ncbi:iron-containing alcohol dehydrogenase [Bacillus sp. DJP31]|uniref:iron-containing alcohol dehydrogenase n=1 Tax=Bacillus sp. DJP31 TaxID=3409789 RepID=UPI003BB68CF1